MTGEPRGGEKKWREREVLYNFYIYHMDMFGFHLVIVARCGV